jgi:hypothetical protein
MLDFEAAKRVAFERWLSAFVNEPGGPAIIQDDQCEEFEWGWLISWGPSDPEKVATEKRRWGRLPILVDRITGEIQLVSTAGPNIAIMKLLQRRPASCQSPDVTQEELGGLTKVTVSMRAFTPLRDLQQGSESAGSIEVFRRTKG